MAYFEMSRLALKWALTKPPTSRYPFEPRRALAGSRGQSGLHQGQLRLLHRLRQEMPDRRAGRESRAEEMGD